MSEAGDIVAWVTNEVAAIDGRIHPIILPDTPTLPAITYQLVSEPQDPTQDGPGMAEPRYRFKVWASSYVELGTVVAELKAAFNGRHDGPFRSSFVEASVEDFDRGTKRFWRVVDVVGWQPAVPAGP